MVISAASHLTEGVFVTLKELSSTERERKKHTLKKRTINHIKFSGFGKNRRSMGRSTFIKALPQTYCINVNKTKLFKRCIA